MTRYNHSRFTPGNKANLRLFMNKAFIRQYHQHFDTINTGSRVADEQLCRCIQNKSNSIKQGWNDPSQTENKRISQILTGTLGGKTTFGNNNKPILLNYLGGYEGQSGGLPKPPRNKF